MPEYDPKRQRPGAALGKRCWTCASLMKELGLGTKRNNRVLRRYGAVLETPPGWPLTRRDIELLITVARARATDNEERRRRLEEFLETAPELQSAPRPGEGDS